MSLLQGFRPANGETQGYERNEFQIACRLRDVCGIKKLFGLFSADRLPSGLLSYLDRGS